MKIRILNVEKAQRGLYITRMGIPESDLVGLDKDLTYGIESHSPHRSNSEESVEEAFACQETYFETFISKLRMVKTML